MRRRRYFHKIVHLNPTVVQVLNRLSCGKTIKFQTFQMRLSLGYTRNDCFMRREPSSFRCLKLIIMEFEYCIEKAVMNVENQTK